MKLFLILSISLFATAAFSQSKALEKADRLFVENAYPAAIEAYQKAIDDDPTDAKAVSRLADCYRLTDDHRTALRWYAKAAKMKEADPEVWFHYGEELMINRKYQEALPWLEKYQRKVPEDDRVADMITSCNNLEAFAATKSMYQLRRLTINSEYSDFGPAFFGNSVIFASSRKRSLTKFHRTGDSFLDFYVASYAGKPELGEPTLFRGALNTPVHEANACFSADGKEMFFTRNNVPKAPPTEKGQLVQLALYHSLLVDGKWQAESLLPFNQPTYSYGHPALSPDDSVLFFVSNMPGGFGGTDIYAVKRSGSEWGKPENLGQDINTKGNEMFPWMDAHGMLYFASNGRGGLGALDIFMVNPAENVVGDPVNLGAPINSPYDDFSFVLDEKNGIGFFTSNRLGGQGDDDLYAVTKLIRWEAEVVDSSGAPIAYVLVDLREGRSRTQMTTDEGGKFLVGLKPGASYMLFLKKAGFPDQKIEFKASMEMEESMTIYEMKRQ